MFGVFHIYGLLIGLGIWAAYEVSLRYGKKIKVAEKIINEGLWWVLAPGLVGARAYHVIDLWKEIYANNLLQIIKVWEGGLGIWGGILGGMLGLMAFSRVRRLNLLQLLDVGVIGVPLAQAIGRWGNYFNGELLGKNGEPLFLYESLLNLLLFAILLKVSKKKETGKLTGGYLIGYGLIRFFLEMLRPAEIVWKVKGIPVAQLMAIGAIVLGFSLLKRTSRHHQESGRRGI